MRMVLFELKKLAYDKGFVCVSVLLLLLCAVYAVFSPPGDSISQRNYENLKQDISGRTQQEIGEILEERVLEYRIYDSLLWGGGNEDAFQDSRASRLIEQYDLVEKNAVFLTGQLALYEKEYQNWLNIQKYPEHIAKIIKAGDESSVFSLFEQENSFSRRNILTSANAYQALVGTEPEYAISKGVVNTISNTVLDFSLIVILCFAAYKLFSEEKSTGKNILTLSMKNGTRRFAAAKLLSLMLLAFAASVLFMLVVAGCNEVRYGLGNMLRPLQSVEGYYNSPLPLSVAGYFGVAACTKAAAVLCIAFAAALFSLFTRNQQEALFLTAAFLTAHAAVFYAINILSEWAPLKSISVFSLFHCEGIYQTYMNLDIFHYAVYAALFSWVSWIVWISVFLISVLIFYPKHTMVSAKRRSILPAKKVSVRITANELYRIFIERKGLVFLLAIGLGYAMYIGSITRPLDLDDMMYADYIREVGGEITQDTYTYIQQEQDRFDAVNQALAALRQSYAEGQTSSMDFTMRYSALSKELMGERSLQRVVNQLHTVAVNKDAMLIYDTAYLKLTATGGLWYEWMPAAIGMLLLLLWISPSYASDKETGVSALIRSTQNGKKPLMIRRIAICAVLSGVVSLAVYGIQFLRITSLYGDENLWAPIQSLIYFVGYPLPVSVGAYLLLLNLLRCAAFVFAGLLMLLISYVNKRIVTSMTVSALTVGMFFLILLH